MIPDNTRVWIETDNVPTSGRVISMAGTPRSYIIETPTETITKCWLILEMTVAVILNLKFLNRLRDH